MPAPVPAVIDCRGSSGRTCWRPLLRGRRPSPFLTSRWHSGYFPGIDSRPVIGQFSFPRPFSPYHHTTMPSSSSLHLSAAASRLAPDTGTLERESSPQIEVDRAIRRNRYWAHRLGWGSSFGALTRLLGFTRMSPTVYTFSLAVARWQRRYGLTIDGILGPKTWRAMQQHLRARPPQPSASGASVPPDPASVLLGSLTLKGMPNYTETVALYPFSTEDLIVTARMLEGENSGRETPETAGVLWALLNLYAFIQHHRERDYPTFAALLYKYSSPLHHRNPLRNRPWHRLRTSSKRQAILGLTGRLPNPVGNATDFANPAIYYKRRDKRRTGPPGRWPTREQWLDYIHNVLLRHKSHLDWIGPVEGIQQYGRNTFFKNRRLRGVPEGIVRVRPPR